MFDELKSGASAIVNKDDNSWKDLTKNTKANVVGYAVDNNADLKIKNIEYDLSGTCFDIEFENKNYSINTKLIGMFNAYNATAAFGACIKLGIDTTAVIDGIKIHRKFRADLKLLGQEIKK